ncbi:hypothetical protein N7U49_03680 [Streptomyces sp. AD2-2]|nr:hypothetical protein N7U49_03680 [Streptomyces sp. AD2-2]
MPALSGRPAAPAAVSPRASDMETTALRLPSFVTPLRVMYPPSPPSWLQ